jgi:hypothetical protein
LLFWAATEGGAIKPKAPEFLNKENSGAFDAFFVGKANAK